MVDRMTRSDLAALLGLDPATVAAWPERSARRTTTTCEACGTVRHRPVDAPEEPCPVCAGLPELDAAVRRVVALEDHRELVAPTLLPALPTLPPAVRW